MSRCETILNSCNMFPVPLSIDRSKFSENNAAISRCRNRSCKHLQYTDGWICFPATVSGTNATDLIFLRRGQNGEPTWSPGGADTHFGFLSYSRSLRARALFNFVLVNRWSLHLLDIMNECGVTRQRELAADDARNELRNGVNVSSVVSPLWRYIAMRTMAEVWRSQ